MIYFIKCFAKVDCTEINCATSFYKVLDDVADSRPINGMVTPAETGKCRKTRPAKWQQC